MVVAVALRGASHPPQGEPPVLHWKPRLDLSGQAGSALDAQQWPARVPFVPPMLWILPSGTGLNARFSRCGLSC